MTKTDRRPSAAAGLALAALLMLSPAVAEACAVCMGGSEEEVRTAFIVTTVFLSACPLLMVGGLAWWLRRLSKAREAEEEDATPHPAGAPLPRATRSLGS